MNTSSVINSFSNEDLSTADKSGADALEARDYYERSENSKPLEINSPSYRHQKSVPTTSRASSLSRAGYASDYATKAVIKK